VWDAAAAAERVPGLGAAAVKALSRFMQSMTELRTLAGTADAPGQPAPASVADAAAERGAAAGAPGTQAGDAPGTAIPVGDLIEVLLGRTGYLEALAAEGTIEAQGRAENLEQLVGVGHEFDAAAPPGEGTLGNFLQEIALLADADSRSDEEGLVTLMTVHNAKGLEYPIVFIAGCEDGVFPHSRALDEGGLEEERRLFYVGVTRAMRELYLTYALRRAVFGADRSGLRSRFLDELPAELLDEAPAPRPASWRSPAPARFGRNGADARGGSTLREQRWAVADARAAATEAHFRLGEDVVHAAFGEGVVTAVEPDGVIVVRFAGDGSERKLMAEYAPVSRR
jgi:DNA helicase-2/ATP-dependent DNA helicase PcrA